MRYAVALLSLSMIAAPARAQLITIRTLPVSQGDQFEFFPSNNLGMAGLTIATPDTLLDPFRNPAAASRVASRVFSSPGVYSVSSGAGAGRTLPLGGFIRAGRWFGSLAIAAQQVDRSQPDPFFGPIVAFDSFGSPIAPQGDLGTGSPSHGNMFALATFGRLLPGRVAIAGTISWARLYAVDGVDLMYDNSQRVDQSGHSFDARLGVLKDFTGGATLQAVVVHNRYAMNHDVLFLDNFWDPGTQQLSQRARNELNDDETNTWGAHVEYARTVSPGVRLGVVATANRMSHPKIPDFTIMSIPNDPGYSSAFNLGVGLTQQDGPRTFGVELLHEPIWSHTWAETAGVRTIDNRFRFSNYVFRMGFGRDFDIGGPDRSATLQVGLIVRRNAYRMAQQNLVDGTSRSLDQSWTEWTPTWGMAFKFPDIEFRYRGGVTNGAGRPGISSFVGCLACRFEAPAGGGVVVAPSGPVALTDVQVVSHQVSISVPLRGRARTSRSAEQ